MKITVSTFAIAALFAATTAQAGPFGLPDHEKDGRYDNGCDVTLNVPIPNSNAFSNSSCPVGGGGAVYPQGKPVDPEPETPVEYEPETPVDPAPVCRTTGCA